MGILSKTKQSLIYFFLLAASGTFGFLPKLVLAQDTPNVTAGATDPAIVNCNNFKAQFFGMFNWVPASYCTASGLALFVIQTLINFAGIVTIMFLIIGGFFYLTAAGNEEQTEKGQKIITNSIIGLVVIILASAIVRIISGLVTGGQ